MPETLISPWSDSVSGDSEMPIKSVLVEPADCTDECEALKKLLSKEIADGTITVVKACADGDPLCKALGIQNLKSPVFVLVSKPQEVIEFEED